MKISKIDVKVLGFTSSILIILVLYYITVIPYVIFYYNYIFMILWSIYTFLVIRFDIKAIKQIEKEHVKQTEI